MRMEKILVSALDVIIRRPLSVVAACLVLCAALMAGVPKFELDASVKRYIGGESPIVTHLNWLESEYIEDSNILIMIKPRQGTVFSREALTALREMTTLAWQIPHLRRVDSLANFQHTGVDGDDLVVADLVPEGANLDSRDVERIRHIALNDARLVGSLVDEEGEVAALNLLFTLDISDNVALQKTIDGVEALKADMARRYPDIELYESGFVYMMHQMTVTSAEDGKTIYSTSLVLILGFLVWFFRSLSAALAVLVVGLLSVVGSVGFYGWIGGYLTPPTAMGLLMVLILGLADGIHIVKSVRRLLRAGLARRQAVRESVVSNFTPVALTSITTVVCFLSFNFNDLVGIRLMGNYVAFGVTLAWVLTLTLLPALLCFCPLKAEPEERQGGGVSWRSLADPVIRSHRPILLVSLILILLSAYWISLNELDDSISRHIKPSHPFRVQTRQIEADLTGSVPVIYSFFSGKPGGVADPAFMAKVEDFVAWARQQPEVRYASTYTDTMKQLNQDMNGGAAEAYRLPDNRELAAQYLLLYEMSLPYGLDLANQINLDKASTRVVLSINDLTIREMKAFLHRGQEWLGTNAPEFDSFANSSVLASNLTVEASIWNTLAGALSALAVIGVFLMFTFRAIVPGILCVISVFVPMVVSFGLWGLFVGVVDLPATLALCMVIGISVDFSIHFLSRELHARRVLGYGVDESIRHAFACVGSPVLTSTLALGVGFLVMVLGQFQFGARMGLLTAICIGLSMITIFTLLPGLLLLAGKNTGFSRPGLEVT